MSEWAKEIGISWCGLDTRIRKYGVRKALSMAGKQKGNQRLVTFRGRTMNMTDWGKEIGVRPETIRRRIRLWGVKSALSNGKIRGSAKRK